MLRKIGGAVAGYITIVVLIMIGLTVLWSFIGADGAFKPGTWEATATWAWISIAIGFFVAVAGGWVAVRVGAHRTAAFVLVGAMIVMTIVSALGGAGGVGGARPADIGMREGILNAITPSWFYWLNTILGCFAVLIGAGRAGKLYRSNQSAVG